MLGQYSRAGNTSAGLLYSEKKYAEAEARFAQVTKDYPDAQWAPEALLGVASALDAQGKSADAIAKYEEIKRRYEKSPVIEDAKLSLARLYEAQQVGDLVGGEGIAADHHLQTVVIRRVVAAGDHHAAAGIEVVGREIHHRRGHDPDVDHVHPGGVEAAASHAS